MEFRKILAQITTIGTPYRQHTAFEEKSLEVCDKSTAPSALSCILPLARRWLRFENVTSWVWFSERGGGAGNSPLSIRNSSRSPEFLGMGVWRNNSHLEQEEELPVVIYPVQQVSCRVVIYVFDEPWSVICNSPRRLFVQWQDVLYITAGTSIVSKMFMLLFYHQRP